MEKGALTLENASHEEAQGLRYRQQAQKEHNNVHKANHGHASLLRTSLDEKGRKPGKRTKTMQRYQQ